MICDLYWFTGHFTAVGVGHRIMELNDLGHSAIAPDLPGHGSRRNETATLNSYRDAVLEVMEPDDVLVGHPQAGTVISLVANLAPTRFRHLIYLAAPVPGEGKSLEKRSPRAAVPWTCPASSLATTHSGSMM